MTKEHLVSYSSVRCKPVWYSVAAPAVTIALLDDAITASAASQPQLPHSAAIRHTHLVAARPDVANLDNFLCGYGGCGGRGFRVGGLTDSDGALMGAQS
jgi:hypothetical protein